MYASRESSSLILTHSACTSSAWGQFWVLHTMQPLLPEVPDVGTSSPQTFFQMPPSSGKHLGVRGKSEDAVSQKLLLGPGIDFN